MWTSLSTIWNDFRLKRDISKYSLPAHVLTGAYQKFASKKENNQKYTMNLRAYRSTLVDLKRSYNAYATPRQFEAHDSADNSNGNDTEDMSSTSPALIMICKCQSVADMTVCESEDEIRKVFSLCSLLISGRIEAENNESKSNSLLVPLQKTWLFLTLGLLLLKELMILHSKRRKTDQLSAVQAEKLNSIGSECKELASRQIPRLLEHHEARVRKMCSEILFLMANDEKEDFSALTEALPELHPTVSLDCFPLYQSIGRSLITKIADDLHRSATSRCTNMGDDAFIALDDTTGNIYRDSSHFTEIVELM